MRIERLKANYTIDVRWRFFPLHPDTPNEGRLLSDLFAGRGYDLDAMHAQMKDRMALEGLDYGVRTHTYNSRLAQELAKWADAQSGFEGIHDALYRAYFVDVRNIGDVDVLVGVAGSVGLDPAAAREVLESRLFREAVDEDWTVARRSGVRSVPTFASKGQAVVGAQPYDVLQGLVLSAGAEPRGSGAGGR